MKNSLVPILMLFVFSLCGQTNDNSNIQLHFKDSLNDSTEESRFYNGWDEILADDQIKGKQYDTYIKNKEGKYVSPILPHKIIRSISVSPNQENILFAGLKGDNPGDAKVLISMDYGSSWTYLNKGKPLSDMAADVQAIETSQYDEQIIYAGTWKNGLFVSKNGGNSFAKVENFPSADIRSILFHPSDVSQMIIATTTHGIVSTMDGGETWQTKSKEYLTSSFWAVWKMVQSPFNKNELYALTFQQGLHKSIDFGKTWKIVKNDAKRTYYGLGWEDENTIYCSSTTWQKHFLHKSSDGGNTFLDIENTTEDLLGNFLVRNKELFIGGEKGLYEITNGKIEKRSQVLPLPEIAHLKNTKKGLIIATWGNGILILE